MECKLQIMDEEFIIEAKAGNVPRSFLEEISKYATQENLAFLPFIDESAETIFNIPQLNQIKNEIMILQDKYPYIDPKALQIFTKAIEKTIEEGEYTYLKISCIKQFSDKITVH